MSSRSSNSTPVLRSRPPPPQSSTRWLSRRVDQKGGGGRGGYAGQRGGGGVVKITTLGCHQAQRGAEVTSAVLDTTAAKDGRVVGGSIP